MSRKWMVLLGVLLSVSLVANGVVGYYVVELRKDVAMKAEEPDLVEVADDVDAVQDDLRDAAEVLGALAAEPDFDPSEIEQKLQSLRTDVNNLSDSVDGLFDIAQAQVDSGAFSGSVDASNIKKPFLCFRGDVAVWDFNGLTC